MVSVVKVVGNTASWFELTMRDSLSFLSDASQAYVIGLMSDMTRYNTDRLPLSESVVLKYFNAKETSKFENYQQLGDWLLWSGLFLTQRYQAHKDVNESICRLSYYRCYHLLKKQWVLYEELADQVPTIIENTNAQAQIMPEHSHISC